MTAFSDGIGFGTSSPGQLLNPINGDYMYREIRGGSKRIEILRVLAELDAGLFIRSNGDAASAPGGQIEVSRLIVLRGPQGRVPPGPDQNSTGTIPTNILPQRLQGYDFLYQKTIYAYRVEDQGMTFDPGEIYAIGDKSLYIVFGGQYRVQAGTNLVPGSGTFGTQGFCTISVAGIDYSYNPTQSIDQQSASLPRYDSGSATL